MSASTFDIDEQFIDKDESRFVYREHGYGPTRGLLARISEVLECMPVATLTR